MGGGKEVILEYNKLLLDHSESLLKVAGGLAIFSLLLIANLRKSHAREAQRASLLIALSILACGISFVCGYLANSVVIGSMSDFAVGGKWVQDPWAERFTLGQIVGLVLGVALFVFVVFVYRRVALKAMEHSGSGGG